MSPAQKDDESMLRVMDKETPRDASVLIIDDDQCLCQVLEDLIASWGMKARSCTEPPSGKDWGGVDRADVYLVDVYMPSINGLDLIPVIAELVPDAKTIIITGCADKETAIKALRRGAFDFLEKPVQAEFLYHSICRALDARDKERNLRSLIAELKQSQSELLARKEQLEGLNVRLMETNRAFSTLARNIDTEREEMEKRIALKIGAYVMPAIAKLRQATGLAKHELELDTLSRTLQTLTSGFTMDSRIALALSPTELRVASLIKHGLSTEEIAAQLFISLSTVQTHRKNIRKKLKINSAGYSLRNFLLSKTDEREHA
jgi:FixJ family two-component response regulator